MGEKDANAAPADATVPSDPPPKYTPTASPNPNANASANLASRAAASPAPRPGAPSSSGPGSRKAPPPLRTPILDHLRAHRVILASASPRRKALLSQVGLPGVEVWPSELPEDLPKDLYGPFEYVAATARRKCLDVYQEALKAQEEAAEAKSATVAVPPDPELVIAADTVVVSRAGKILEKPRSAQEHGQMLRHLRDTRVHRVLTAVCVLSPRADAAHPGYVMAAHTEETSVVFAQAADGLTDAVIDSYVRTREGADKAGGYALQGQGGLVLVERIEGSMDNVIGLPVRQLLLLADKAIFHQSEEDEEESGSDDE